MNFFKILLFALFYINANAQIKENQQIKLEGDTIKISFITIGDWIFIDGEINNTKGRWMFDTGKEKAISLNADKLKNLNPNEIGTGFVGSGQTFKTFQYQLINTLKIDDFQYDSIPNLTGDNLDFLYPITSEVIGMIGFGFFKGYDLKIDYLRNELTFYRQQDSKQWDKIKKNKEYITTLNYFTKKQENVPMINIDYKGTTFLATFDTGGGKGTFTIEESTFKKLNADQDISYSYNASIPLFTWHNLKINKKLKFDLFGLLKMDESPAFKPLGITEKNVISLDYSFLSKHITIWDTKNKQIHVFENK